jgi:hypothetical protein
METLFYKNNIEKDYQTVAVIDWKNFGQEVKQRPEDYVFILSSDEWNKFMELDRQIRAGLKGKDAIQEAEYINQYQGILAIAALAIQPDFLKRYKIGSYPLDRLGLSHTVYFISRSTDEVERTKAVLKRIKDFKANTIREDHKRN